MHVVHAARSTCPRCRVPYGICSKRIFPNGEENRRHPFQLTKRNFLQSIKYSVLGNVSKMYSKWTKTKKKGRNKREMIWQHRKENGIRKYVVQLYNIILTWKMYPLNRTEMKLIASSTKVIYIFTVDWIGCADNMKQYILFSHSTSTSANATRTHTTLFFCIRPQLGGVTRTSVRK